GVLLLCEQKIHAPININIHFYARIGYFFSALQRLRADGSLSPRRAYSQSDFLFPFAFPCVCSN
ncbi:hypothetical protein, partial [Undibacterium sp. TJN19]|uniref:hypothetical protein n=1 Tax=Undibacterium sp. TJN19 TaxID=3413055 RepID=UPI003BEFF786